MRPAAIMKRRRTVCAAANQGGHSMANGILIIDKPAGWTSMDVCAKLRGMFHEKRVGHAGTLDPMATGVLPVFIGRATRAVEFATESEKEYIAGLKLGVITNTQDTTGEILEERAVEVNGEQLLAVLRRFTGDIEQTPPMYSAIKINGKKLYELARKGKEVERRPRPVTIHALELLGWPDAGEDFTLRVVCSKGTYVRTLCHDIGQALGCGGCMSSLRRVQAAGFTLEDAVSLEAVQAAVDRGEGESLLLPVDCCFAGLPMLVLKNAGAEKRLRNGAALRAGDIPDGEYRVYGVDKTFLALGRASNGTFSTVKSFFEV